MNNTDKTNKLKNYVSILYDIKNTKKYDLVDNVLKNVTKLQGAVTGEHRQIFLGYSDSEDVAIIFNYTTYDTHSIEVFDTNQYGNKKLVIRYHKDGLIMEEHEMTHYPKDYLLAKEMKGKGNTETMPTIETLMNKIGDNQLK